MKLFYILILLITATTVHATCTTIIMDSDNTSTPIMFFNTLITGRQLIAQYSPRKMQRRFTNNRVCVNDQLIYAVTANQIYASKQKYTNTNNVVYMQFPLDFQPITLLQQVTVSINNLIPQVLNNV